jgi:hypothetical protein
MYIERTSVTLAHIANEFERTINHFARDTSASGSNQFSGGASHGAKPKRLQPSR